MRRVIGIGSPFGADRAAWDVIEKLKGRVPADVELIPLDRPGAALINWLHREDEVTLIDAAIGCPPDTDYLQLDPGELQRQRGRIDSHTQRLADVLALAEVLKRMPKRLVIYAIHIVAKELSTVSGGPPTGVTALAEHLAKDLSGQAPQPDQQEPDDSRTYA